MCTSIQMKTSINMHKDHRTIKVIKNINFLNSVLQVKDNTTYEFDKTAAWRIDSYYSMGILGFGLFVLLGITSLPSVSNSLNWREFNFVQVLRPHSVEMHTFECHWRRFC